MIFFKDKTYTKKTFCPVSFFNTGQIHVHLIKVFLRNIYKNSTIIINTMQLHFETLSLDITLICYKVMAQIFLLFVFWFEPQYKGNFIMLNLLQHFLKAQMHNKKLIYNGCLLQLITSYQGIGFTWTRIVWSEVRRCTCCLFIFITLVSSALLIKWRMYV